MSSGKALHLRKLNKSFFLNGKKKTILNSIDLDVQPGEFITVLGPSGCGKSTLLRIIAGLERPDLDPDTELLLDGRPIQGPGPDRGLVFQTYSSFPWLTVKENVKFGLRFILKDKQEQEERAQVYLDLVGLSQYQNVYPRQLSGGQQQRVAIARTLATRPQLLLMDEPFAALDAQNRELQQTELLRIWKETQPTILFITHDIAEAIYLGQRVIVLSHQPASILAEVNTIQELEEKIMARSSSAMRTELIPLNRGDWIHGQPEFFELIARLKKLLHSSLE